MHTIMFTIIENSYIIWSSGSLC